MLHSAQSRNVSSNHFEALFEYATIGILITDSNGVITAINPFALNEFGYTRKELLGKKIEMLIPTRFQGQHVRNREHYSKRPQTRPMGVGMDLFALKKDGTEFPVEVSLGNYHTNGDRYVIAFVTNISVRKKGETEIKQLNDDLEATVERRTKELTNAMHQLEISKEEGPKISYPIAVLKESRDPQNALRFYQYLLAEKALEIFQKYGFLITTEKHPEQ